MSKPQESLFRSPSALFPSTLQHKRLLRPPKVPIQPPRNPSRPLHRQLTLRVWLMENNTPATEQESSTAHALEAPYRAPAAYDFARLRSLVDAKCREANDHFLLVREDPAYFAELIHEECGHTIEAILDRSYDPRVTRLSAAAWNEAISRCLMNAYHDAFMWEGVSVLFDQLIATYTKQKAVIHPGQALPDTYVETFSRLGFFLDCVIVGYLGALPEYMSAVPTFRRLMNNKPYGSKYDSFMEKKPGTCSSSY